MRKAIKSSLMSALLVTAGVAAFTDYASAAPMNMMGSQLSKRRRQRNKSTIVAITLGTMATIVIIDITGIIGTMGVTAILVTIIPSEQPPGQRRNCRHSR